MATSPALNLCPSCYFRELTPQGYCSYCKKTTSDKSASVAPSPAPASSRAVEPESHALSPSDWEELNPFRVEAPTRPEGIKPKPKAHARASRMAAPAQKVDAHAISRRTPEVAGTFDLRGETARLLDSCQEWVRRFVVLSAQQAIILACWILHTWTIHSSSATPYIHVTSAELGSGKTILLVTLKALVREPCLTDNMSPAALARIVSTVRPTLLIDELDAVLQADKERAQDLRGILNGGYELHGAYTRCVGKDFKVEHFSTFCPKVLCGIGELWPTVASRSIRIEIKRKLPTEHVEPFRTKRVQVAAEPLRAGLETWAANADEALQNLQEPADIPGLTDRQADIVEPLLRISALAGERYLQSLTDALRLVLTPRSGEDHGQSIGVLLLGDIRTVFDEEGTDKLPSVHLAERLCSIEGRPWAEWTHGRGMTPNLLARQLCRYGIVPGTIRKGNATIKGYRRGDFEDSWDRLCPLPPLETVTASQPAPIAAETAFSKRHTTPDVTDTKSGSNPHEYSIVTPVTAQEPEDGEKAVWL